MENKINIAKILESCPRGMELDCTIWNNVTLGRIDSGSSYSIEIKINGDKKTTVEYLTEFGEWDSNENSKCVIFPKGKTTWEGFVPPYQFKDGDVLFVDCSDGEDMEYRYIFIVNNPDFRGKWYSYCHLDGFGYFHSKETYLTDEEYHPRLATEEEKQKLFQAMKDNGYRWNDRTKSLEKLITPKFKAGDVIRNKKSGKLRTITQIRRDCYELDDRYALVFENQDNWKLAPTKFDINTLVPFESRVLVRDYSYGVWKVSFWGCLLSNEYGFIYDTIRGSYKQCIPYEGNEHLLGTANDCDSYFKTWE